MLRWLPALAYWVAISLGHLSFTRWLLQPRQNAWLGAYAFKNAVPAALAVGSLFLLVWVVRGVRRDPRGTWIASGYWLFWAACVGVIDRLMTYSVYEYAHYPEYALLAWLVGWALDPRRAGNAGVRILFWTVLLGVVDEWMQYLWITSSYSNYLDFNDFVVNLLGAAAGMMLYASPMTERYPALGRPEWGAALGVVLLVGAASLAGALHISPAPGIKVPPGGRLIGSNGWPQIYLQREVGWYGSRQKGHHRDTYWVMSPSCGLLVLALLGGVFVRSGRPSPMEPASYPSACSTRN